MEKLIGKYLAVFWGQDEAKNNTFYAGKLVRVTKTALHVEMNFGKLEKVEISLNKSWLVFKEDFLSPDILTWEQIKPLTTRVINTTVKKEVVKPVGKTIKKELDKPVETEVNSTSLEEKLDVKPEEKPVKSEVPVENPDIVKSNKPLVKQQTVVKAKLKKPVVEPTTKQVETTKVKVAKTVKNGKTTDESVKKPVDVKQDTQTKPVVQPTIEENTDIVKSLGEKDNHTLISVGDTIVKFNPALHHVVTVVSAGNRFALLDVNNNYVEDETGLPIYLRTLGTAGSFARILMSTVKR